MSLPMTLVKEKLKLIVSQLEKIEDNKAKNSAGRLRKLLNIVEENESKIWLRTKVGQPMVSSVNDSVDSLLRVLEREVSSRDEIDGALLKVEELIGKLDEESRRRGMVVT